MNNESSKAAVSADSRHALGARALELSGFAKQAAGLARVFYAPGRVNLIGEHIDYNGGLVFPCAVTSGIALAVQPRNDNRLSFRSSNFDFVFETDLEEPITRVNSEWVNYPLGVFREFRQLEKSPATGLDLFYLGDLPDGSGVSSSAAIESVTAFALNALIGSEFERVSIAQLCQRAENDFVGVSCGIMDQFAVTVGKEDHAIELDCNTLDYKHVPLRTGDSQFVLANTNQKRDMAEAGYNTRVAECQRALALLPSDANINNLAELAPSALEEFEHLFASDLIALQRARHVVAEHDRVKRATTALEADRLAIFGELMNASHASLRDLYEVSSDPLDYLVDAAAETAGTLGSRLTGAGFGGCTVSLVNTRDLDGWIDSVSARYAKTSGLEASFFVFRAADGVCEITEASD